MIETKFKDWHNVTIGNLGSTYNGLTGKKASDFGHGVAKYVPFINVIYNPIIDVNSLCCVDVKPSEYQNAVIKGDLLFNTSSETPEEVAMCSYVDTDIQNLYLNSFCFGFRLNDSNVSGLFLSYLFRSKFGRSLMLELAQGSTRYNLQKKKFLQTELHIPQILAEQERIAEALSDVDALIKELDALIEKKRMVLKATMQDLLTARRRLPGFSDPWQDVKLENYSSITMGQSPSSNYYNTVGNGLPLIQGNADIFNRKSIIRNYTSQVTKTCESGDIIMSVRAPVGTVSIASNKSCIGRGVCAFKANKFLYYMLLFMENRWSELSSGSTFDSVNGKQISEFKIFVPTSLSEQRAIAEAMIYMLSL